MEHTSAAPLKKTPLHARHRALNAKMVPFGGWDMPIEYSGITAEHLAVRERVGLFDVSHMGEIEIAGKNALDAVQRISSNDASKLAVGQAQYSGLLTPAGTFVDDLLVYRLAPQHFLLVVNASHIPDDYAHIAEHIKPAGDAIAVDASSRYALLALQGPRALEVLQPLTGVDLATLKYYWFAHGEFASVRGTVSRTGYTGEDGFEIFVPPQMADRVWMALMQAGADAGIVPCGLGARDTLRLEVCYPLHGNELTPERNPIEAGLGWCCKEATGFIGSEAIARARAEGTAEQLVAFKIEGQGIPREGNPVLHDGEQVGAVTSGTFSPSLEVGAGMAYVNSELAEIGTEIEIDVRGKHRSARIASKPLYP
jgi:aminomethyltransferase